MTALNNNNLSKFCHSLMLTFVALSIGLSSYVNGRSLNPLISLRRHLRNNYSGTALNRPLHERSTYSRRRDAGGVSYYDRAEQMDRLALLLAYMMRNTNLVESSRGKRQLCDPTKDARTALVETYVEFHDRLAIFFGNYTSRLKPSEADSALKDVSAILELMPKDSKILSSGKISVAIEGINQTLQMTEYVLRYGAPYLQQSSQGWFTGERVSVSIHMSRVYQKIACVIKEGGNDHVQEEQSGIGGGNTALMENVSSSTWLKIKAIAAKLLSHT